MTQYRLPLSPFDTAFSIPALVQQWEHHSKKKRSVGRDRVSVEHFEKELAHNLHLIHDKVHDLSYRFSSYKELLLAKGRDKAPRVVSIPTVRDRVVLRALKDSLESSILLAGSFVLPNQAVRELAEHLYSSPPTTTTVIRFDIRDFYGSCTFPHIHNVLDRQRDERLTCLVMRALRTPTIAQGRPSRGVLPPDKGIPQGLSLSNFLAMAYLEEFDSQFRSMGTKYTRYVDDLVFVVDKRQSVALERAVRVGLRTYGLEVNSSKSEAVDYQDAFSFLGYEFQGTTLRPKKSAVERLLAAIAGILARHAKSPSPRHEVAAHEINERITGSIADGRQFGWIFYYSATNDMQLLKSIDSSIARIVTRILPSVLALTKSIFRSFYESRFSKYGGYILNYDRYKTSDERAGFLVDAGVISTKQAAAMSPWHVNRLFFQTRARRLRALEADIGHAS